MKIECEEQFYKVTFDLGNINDSLNNLLRCTKNNKLSSISEEIEELGAHIESLKREIRRIDYFISSYEECVNEVFDEKTKKIVELSKKINHYKDKLYDLQYEKDLIADIGITDEEKNLIHHDDFYMTVDKYKVVMEIYAEEFNFNKGLIIGIINCIQVYNEKIQKHESHIAFHNDNLVKYVGSEMYNMIIHEIDELSIVSRQMSRNRSILTDFLKHYN